MSPARKKTPGRAANRRTSATASDNRGRRNGRLQRSPHGAILPNERGTLLPSRLLPSKPGNITAYRVAVAQQCACPTESGGGARAQHQFNLAVQPPGEGFPQLVNAAAPPLPTIALPHPPYAVLLQPSYAVPLQPYSAKPRCQAVPEQRTCPAASGGDVQHQFDFAVQPPGEGYPQLVNATAPQLPTIALPHPPYAVPLQPFYAAPLQPSRAKPRCPAVPEQRTCPAASGGDVQHQFDFAVQPPGEGYPQLVNATAPQLPTIALPHPPYAVPLQPFYAAPLQPSRAKPRCPAVPEVGSKPLCTHSLCMVADQSV
ncbi:uncharacterized protein LOC142768870 [Rhipicephalus microplus]|uniref:uncharacterized protein LOC142768870 n=1 Tax=Rhipicephalus microplus TaxID=6941 RepID=UPI003F6CC8EA